METLLDNLLNRSLRFVYTTGSITTQTYGADTEWRMLPDMVLTFQKSGRNRVFLRNKPSIPAKDGELIVIPAGLPHRIVVESPTATYQWMHVNYYLLNDLDLFSFIHVPIVVKGVLAAKIGKIIKEWILFVQKSSNTDPLLFHARKNETGFRVLTALADRAELFPQGQEKLNDFHRIWPTLEYIHGHFSASLDRDALAERATMSAAQLHRVFYRAMGVRPMEYVRTVRLRQAQQLLLTTELTIAEIARKVGYEDPFVFSRFFKRECNLSPTDYRRDTKRKHG